MFNNTGTLTVNSVGTGTATIADTFNNSGGMVTVNPGTLTLSSGGTETGAFSVVSGATLNLSGGAFAFNSGSSVSGTGAFTVGGATANFMGTSAINPSTVNLTSGALNFNNTGTLTLGVFNMSGGTLAGSNPVFVSGGFDWTGGTVGTGLGTVTLNVNGGSMSGSTGNVVLDGGQLSNSGALSWAIELYDGNGSAINNSGTITITSTASSAYGTADAEGGTRGVFTNTGMLIVNGVNTGTATIADNFTNIGGTVNVSAGTLDLADGHNLTGGTLNSGISSQTTEGQITLAGAAALTGTLSANLLNGYVPNINNSFQLVNYTSFTGAFTNTNLPPIAVWQTAYNAANVTITLLKFVPTITWPTPASIVYGTPLSGTQLDATASSPSSVTTLTGPGTYTYSLLPAGTPVSAGTILNASNQTLAVVFTPSAGDQAHFSSATNTVNIDVTPLPVVLTGTRTYDATATAASTILSVANIVGSDVVNVASGSATLAAATVGSETITSIGTLTLGGGAAANYTLTGASGSVTITPKALTMNGLSVPSSKVYDGTILATVIGSPGSLTGAESSGSGTSSDGLWYTGDMVSITGTATGTYNSKDVGAATMVAFGGLSLTGNQAGDYTLTIQSAASAIITPKALTAQGTLSISSKVYDGTTSATPSGAAALKTAESAGTGNTSDGMPYTGNGDAVSLTGTASYAYNTKDVATATTVTESGLSLAGGGSANYTLTPPSLSAAITAKALTMSGLSVASSKVYDGTTTAAVSGSPGTLTGSESTGSGNSSDGKWYVGDTVSLTGTATGTYNSKNVGTATTVMFGGLSLTGASAGDYALMIQSSASATITVKALTMSGLSVPSSKIYDGTTMAVVSGSPGSLQSAEAVGTGSTGDGKRYSGDTVGLTGTATGTYNSKNVGTANTVTFGGVSLNGAQSGDYSLTIQSPASATITGALLTITASSQTKTYGQTVTFGSGSTLFTSSPLQNGETIGTVTLTVTGNGGAASAPVSGSPYTITPSAATGGTFLANNYSITYDTGLLTVTLPLLYVTGSPPNMILTWTTSASAFVLNQTASLAPPITWMPITSGISVSGTNNTITINDGSGSQYYALIAP